MRPLETDGRQMTARKVYRLQKCDSPRIGGWLKWAAVRFLPARRRTRKEN